MMGITRGIVAALLPLIFAVLAAFGVVVSDDVRAVLERNLEAILIALGTIGTVVPGIVAAWREARDGGRS